MQAGQAARVLVSLDAQEVRQRVRRVRAVRRVDFRSGGVGMKQRCRATRLHRRAVTSVAVVSEVAPLNSHALIPHTWYHARDVSQGQRMMGCAIGEFKVNSIEL